MLKWPLVSKEFHWFFTAVDVAVTSAVCTDFIPFEVLFTYHFNLHLCFTYFMWPCSNRNISGSGCTTLSSIITLLLSLEMIGVWASRRVFVPDDLSWLNLTWSWLLSFVIWNGIETVFFSQRCFSAVLLRTFTFFFFGFDMVACATAEMQSLVLNTYATYAVKHSFCNWINGLSKAKKRAHSANRMHSSLRKPAIRFFLYTLKKATFKLANWNAATIEVFWQSWMAKRNKNRCGHACELAQGENYLSAFFVLVIIPTRAHTHIHTKKSCGHVCATFKRDSQWLFHEFHAYIYFWRNIEWRKKLQLKGL